jgi:hypothetical protein
MLRGAYARHDRDLHPCARDFAFSLIADRGVAVAPLA